MRSFEGAIAAVQRRVRRLRPPDHRARPTMRRGFFPSREAKEGEPSHENRSFGAERVIQVSFLPTARDSRRTSKPETFGNRNDEANAFARRLRWTPVSSYHQALSRDDGAFSFLASSSINQIKSIHVRLRPLALRV